MTDVQTATMRGMNEVDDEGSANNEGSVNNETGASNNSRENQATNQYAVSAPQQAASAEQGSLGFRGSDPRRKSPAVAGFLSILPGLGQVYVGYYRRGFTNVLTAGLVISFLVATEGGTAFTPLAAIFLVFFEFYNMIDAARRATLYNLTLDGVEQVQLPDALSDGPFTGLGGSYIGGGAVLLFGVIALSNTLFGLSLQWLESWWPVLPIAFGVYLIYQAYQDSQAGQESVGPGRP